MFSLVAIQQKCLTSSRGYTLGKCFNMQEGSLEVKRRKTGGWAKNILKMRLTASNYSSQYMTQIRPKLL